MNDFITLTCPNCGGKLEVSHNTLSLICQNCGVEHLIRREAGNIFLESFARCPVCQRNDKVEKVSAIRNSGNGDLVYKLKPPSQPIKESGFANITCGVLSLVIGGVLSLSFALLGIGLRTPSSNNNGVNPLYVGLCWSLFILVLTIFSGIFLIIMGQRRNKKADEIFPNKLKNWQNVIQQWEQLYYCSRDGVVFIPAKSTSAPIEKMTDYISGADKEFSTIP